MTLARHTAAAAGMVIILAVRPPAVVADPLTIYQIQYSTAPDGASPQAGNVVDCAGGICVAKFPGYRPRLVLQDPNYPDAWGAIQVKDWIYPFDMYNCVQIGDWVSLTNMLVEDFRGTTFLQRQSPYDPGYEIVSQGNPLPPPLPVSVSAIPAPVYDPDNPNGAGWYVEHHDAELYESMRLILHDLTVTQKDLGKEVDNYNLQDAEGHNCWAADYMNEDVGPWGYHDLVTIGQHFCVFSGVFEQYTNFSTHWDYYQLVTMTSLDLGLCGDLNCDGAVNTFDIDPFVLALTDETGYYAAYPDCNRDLADVNCDGTANTFDVDPFVDSLTGG